MRRARRARSCSRRSSSTCCTPARCSPASTSTAPTSPARRTPTARAAIDALAAPSSRPRRSARTPASQTFVVDPEPHRLHGRRRRDDPRGARRRAATANPFAHGDRHGAAPLPARRRAARRALRRRRASRACSTAGRTRSATRSRRGRPAVRGHARSSRSRRTPGAGSCATEAERALRALLRARAARTTSRSRSATSSRSVDQAAVDAAAAQRPRPARPAPTSSSPARRASTLTPAQLAPTLGTQRRRPHARPHGRRRQAALRARPDVRGRRAAARRRDVRRRATANTVTVVPSRDGHELDIDGGRRRDPARRPHDHRDDPQRASRARHQVGAGARHHAPGVVVHDQLPAGRAARAQHPSRGRRAQQHGRRAGQDVLAQRQARAAHAARRDT